MRTFHGLPEHVLHDTISVAIELTRYEGWQLSLRLVNRQFNEAVLHVYYLRKKWVASIGGHTLDCINPCEHGFCRQSLMASRWKGIYAARFNFQSLLARRDLARDATHAHQLLEQWKAALAILREVENLKQLDINQVRFYSTCTDNPIFNDASSAILSEAVASYLGLYFLAMLARGRWDLVPTNRYRVHPPAFWVALSACVLGDLQLFETYSSKLAPPIESSSALSPPDLFIAKQPIALLKVAIRNGRLSIVSRLLEQHLNLISGINIDYGPLQAAIFANNNEVLRALLTYTPNLPKLLADALGRYWTLLPRSSSGSETIRLLMRHFSPLSAESRTWLIMRSCAVGDTVLLKEFSKMEPLFSHRYYDAGGRLPSYVHFVIRRGNVDSLRFLLDHGVIEHPTRLPLRMVTDQTLSFNQIECFRELYQRFDQVRSPFSFRPLALADNAEEFIAEFIDKYRDLMFEPQGEPDDPRPTVSQLALWNAIQRLRHRNIQCLLGAGVRVFSWPQSEIPFEIPWSYFNLNQDAFLETQAVLDAFDLPKLRIIV